MPAIPIAPPHSPRPFLLLLAVAFIALAAVLLVGPGTASATTGTAGDLTWATNGTTPETVKITGCSPPACASTIVIPSVIEGLAVTTIGERAFSGASLANITIPDSVTTIEKYAFLDAASLTAVVVPPGVTTIEEQTFYGAGSLTSITLPEGLTTIKPKAFGNNGALLSLRIPASVTTLADEALNLITGLQSIYFLGNRPSTFGANQFDSDTLVTVYRFRDAALFPPVGDPLQGRPQSYILFPATPPAPSAVAGSGNAVVTAVAASIGEAPTNYTITATPGGRSCTADASGTCTVTELSNGTAYTFTAIAHNAAGDSSVSAKSTAVTPRTATPADPAAPQPAADGTTVLTVSTKTTGTGIVTTFTAPGPGSVAQTGTTAAAKDTRGKTIKVCATKKKLKKAGKVTLTCAFTKAAKAARRKGSLTVVLATTFTPTSGAKAISTKTIKLGRR